MNTNQESRGQSPFIQIEDVYCPDTPKPQKSILKTLGNEEDAYCPPTPTPKKSLLKDVQQKKVEHNLLIPYSAVELVITI